MTGSAQKLRSLVRLRESLVKSGRSRKNTAAVCSELSRVKAWLDGNSGIRDEHAEGYVRRHLHTIETLLPGNTCPSHKSWREWLDQIMQGE